MPGSLTWLFLGSGNWMGSTWLLSEYQRYDVLNEINTTHITAIMICLRGCDDQIMSVTAHKVWMMELHRLLQDQMK